MEHNREQIKDEIQSFIKCLKASGGWWENRGRGGWFNHDILEDALSLINELTVENEVRKRCNTMLDNELRRIDNIKADTVRKMHSEIKERCIKGGIYPAFVASVIDQIAKEILEENNEKDTNTI